MAPQDDEEAVGRTLLGLARGAVARALDGGHRVPEHAPWLSEPGATFVTLTRSGRLRGCIGSLVARRALVVDVQANAVAAAFADPRFAPVTAVELRSTHVAVSLLAPPEPVEARSESEALTRLRPGVDGVIFEYAGRRSTFLPHVWEELDDPVVFMSLLKRKAGVPADFWHDEVHLHRYTVTTWKETEPRPGETT